jgi:uncharacterized protein YkwD
LDARVASAAVAGAVTAVVLLAGCGNGAAALVAAPAADGEGGHQFNDALGAVTPTPLDLLTATGPAASASPPAATSGIDLTSTTPDAPTPTPTVAAKRPARLSKPSPTRLATRRVAAARATPTPTRSKPATSSATRPSASPASSTATVVAGAATGTESAIEAEVIRLVNVQRGLVGCEPLTVNSTLVEVAREHSTEMSTVLDGVKHNGLDGRTPFQRMRDAGYTYSLAAENIAGGQPDAASVMTAWMNSPGHRANILNCQLAQIGVGMYLRPGSQYGTYWTQDFGTPM